MTAKGGGSRGPAPGDIALWDAVKKTIKPLHKPRPSKEAAGPPEPTLPEAPARPQKPALTPAEKQPRPEPPKPPPLAGLDRRTRSRVARGRIEIDARLDLHGLTLERARTRLGNFLAQAQARGHALVLVITGKGTSGRGALKYEVPHWLSSSELRPLVIGFEEAAKHHGGAGALYVRVRRSRT